MLAVDRGGTGDAHVVRVCATARSALAKKTIEPLIQTPANYLWLAFPAPRQTHDFGLAPLYLQDGPGRIGLIEVASAPGDTLRASVALEAERFLDPVREDIRALRRRARASISFG